MKHYLTAEWGRAVARPYFRAFLLVLLALAAGLPLLWRFGLGDMFQGSFGDSLSLLTPFFTVGLYLAVVVADEVFSDQYKNDTLKNEVSFGLPRRRIYLGKLVTAAGIGLVLAFLTLLVYARNHRADPYWEGIPAVLRAWSLGEARSRWQLKAAFGVATALVLAHGLGFPRPMWMGIAAMSVLLPSRQAIPGRVKGRIWGNLAGGAGFCLLYCLLPDSLLPYLGIFGGIVIYKADRFEVRRVQNMAGAMAGRRCLTPWAPCPSWWEPWACPAWCSSGWATTPWAPYTPGLWTGWPGLLGGYCGVRSAK